MRGQFSVNITSCHFTCTCNYVKCILYYRNIDTSARGSQIHDFTAGQLQKLLIAGLITWTWLIRNRLLHRLNNTSDYAIMRSEWPAFVNWAYLNNSFFWDSSILVLNLWRSNQLLECNKHSILFCATKLSDLSFPIFDCTRVRVLRVTESSYMPRYASHENRGSSLMNTSLFALKHGWVWFFQLLTFLFQLKKGIENCVNWKKLFKYFG